MEEEITFEGMIRFKESIGEFSELLQRRRGLRAQLPSARTPFFRCGLYSQRTIGEVEHRD